MNEFFSKQRSVDYAALDWTKNDFALSMQTGKSKACIRQKRKELGKMPVAERKTSFNVIRNRSVRKEKECSHKDK